MADFLPKDVIAMRVAKELENGQVVNLGIGIPSLCSQYIPRDKDVIFHSENGVLNFGPLADASEINPDFFLTNREFYFFRLITSVRIEG